MSAEAPVPGEIVLEHASRAFSVRGDQGRTLKDLVLRREGEGPPPVQALADVSLHVAPGETVGMVGRNGAGKTSTLRVLAGIVPLDSGVAACGGRVVSLLELGAGFGRDFTGRENIELNGALYGLDRHEIAERMDAIIAFSELGHFIDSPVKTYSSGMMVRLGFAIAAHLPADVLLIDEVLAVGDVSFQRKCLRRISERIAAGATLIFVSHDTGAIERVCERVVVLDGGRVAFDGTVAEGLLFYHRLMGAEQGGGESVRQPGSRALVVADLELQDAAGRSRVLFRTGDPLRVSLRVEARRPVAAARLALEVRDGAGNSLFRTEVSPELNDGVARLRFDVSRLGLLGGDYDLVVEAYEHGQPSPGADRVLSFSVAAEPGAEGVVDLRGTWSDAERAEVAR